MYTESEVVAVMSGYTGILAIICLFVGVVYTYCTSPDRIEIVILGRLLAILSLLGYLLAILSLLLRIFA